MRPFINSYCETIYFALIFILKVTVFVKKDSRIMATRNEIKKQQSEPAV